MNSKLNTKILSPFSIFLIMCLSWLWFYKFDSLLNESGAYKPEWIMLIDGFVVLPLLILWLSDNSCLIIVLGMYLIPLTEKYIWNHLSAVRYIFVAGFILFELFVIYSVLTAMRLLFRGTASVNAVDKQITKIANSLTSNVNLVKLITLEIRVWSYALFAHRVVLDDENKSLHFSQSNNGGTKPNILTFIFLIVIELPIVHLFCMLVWSSVVANILSLLTLFGLLFMVGMYRSVELRYTCIDENTVLIRYGVFNENAIAFTDILAVTQVSERVYRAANIQRYYWDDNPNIEITLKKDEGISKVYLQLDEPSVFTQVLKKKLSFER